MDSLHTKADSVRAAVSSTATCTPATASILSEILLSPINAKDTKPPPKSVKYAKTPAPKVKATKTPAAKARGRKVVEQEDIEEHVESLSTKERSILATEVINTTLKALTEAIKAPPSVQKQAYSKDRTKSSVRHALRRSSSVPQSPLGSRSLNRVSSSPSLSTRKSRSSSSASITSCGNRSIAECARTAFACLRSLQASKTAGVDFPALQLENGMSVLIGKLIALGLDDLAIKEVRILKRRLGPDDPPVSKKATTTGKVAIPAPITQGLGELLDFGPSAATGPKLGMIITTQLQILRLMTSSRKNRNIEAALDVLRPSHPSSPTKLLLLAAKDPKQANKIARQLQSLSELLLSLTPSISSSEDTAALEPRISVAPENALQLQTLALQNRILWWKLAGHKGDPVKELLDPFFRCLSAFARRSQCSVRVTYATSKQAFLSLKEALSDSQNDPSIAPKIFAGIYRLLGSLSQDAKLVSEAISWTENVQALLDPKCDSDAKRCAVVARLVALKLLGSSDHSEIEEELLALLDGLEHPFKGEASEIEEVMSEVSLVRRAAISLLAKRNTSETSAPNSMDGVRQMCESLIFLCPRLCLRYLGKTPDSASATKDIVRYEQRRMFIAKLGVHAIDSALFLIRLHISEGRLEWDLMDSLLQDCLSLLDRVDTSSKDADIDDGASSVSYYVRISNLYSTHYLNLRRDAQSSKDIQQQQRTLRRSIDAVRSRPQQERRSALLPTKLEKMAEIHKTTGRYDELFKTLLNLRDEMINQQVLSVIASAAATQPIPRAWDVNDDASLLARTLNSLLKVLLKYGFSVADMPILEDSWSTEEKGAMLEKQLDIIFGQSNYSHTAVALRNKLIRALVDVYEGNQYPIRRLRVYTRLLSLELSDRTEIVNESKDPFNYTAVQDVDLNGSKDEGLRRYLPHLNTLAASSVQLHQDHPNMDILKECLVVWSSCLRECKSLEALEGKVDDVPGLLAHLKSMADYIEMKGCGTTRIVVLRLISEINELFVNVPGPDGLILSYKDLGLQWLHLGYSGKAGLALDKAQSYSNQNGVMPQTLLELHLSYAEYLMAIGSLDKCEEHLKQAHAAACENGGILSDVDQKTTLQRRTRRNQLLANAFLLHSMLALDRGAPQVALGHAKQSVRLLRRAWANLENQMRRRPSHSKNVDNSDTEKITEECSDLSLSQVSAQTSENDTHSTLVGPSFWSLISPLFRSISFLSEIYAHSGMFQETLHYAEQAQKLVQEINSNAFLAIASGAVGATWLRAGRLDKASEVLTEAKKLCALDEKSRHTVNIACYLGELYGLLGEREAEIQAYEEAESALASITASDLINSMDRMTEPVDTLEVQMSQLAITKTKAKITRNTTTARAKVIVKRKTVAKAKAPAQTGPTIAEACPQLASLKAAVFRKKAKAIMLSKGCEEALSLLEQADSYCSTQNDVVYQGISMAKQLLLQSLEQMTADPVYSVLQDSTISYPSIAGLSKAEKAADRLSLTRQSPPSKNLNVPVNSRSRSKSPTPGSFFDKLRQAQDHLIAIHSNAVKSAPVSVVHIISALLNSVAILLSAAGPVKGKSLGHPGFATCSIETARTIAIRREHKAVQADQQGHKIEHPRWPIPAQASDSRRISLGIPSYDMSRFQRDYIDIIPSSWTAISISLSDNRQELSITKFQAGHSPFVLRLPLGRNTSIDADEEVFGFEQGHSELMEIIDSANQSAHSARDMTTKDAREAWWEEREALDARLKDLLENIDKVWLGGFKGIFSQNARRPDLLARFQRSFQTILDKHLPSRQKIGKKSKGPRTALDTRILDLFIGLGDASAEDCDLDEPLTDLLYFVVDILQFHGELNAYAEIDFDSIVIEIHDALRCYHEAVQTMGNDESRHTILILDKALHAFPWESLPCMEGLAVSRLPSMGCLRDRIINPRQTMSEDNTEKQYINRDNGSFILNPEGDLKSTQATFQKDLLGLKGWDGVIKREPSEPEIKRQLESKDLFLYFGHGSGAQYIRAREIRRTENCAVTFLMGCSSGALVDAKEFEPYGPPINYMHAGCPALVATLWDITDKDIDRFAKSTFEHWGLFGSEQGGIGKGKGRKKAEPISDRQLSVVEAVAKGREACNLRYLNAAAVCVYGVPVYLK